MVKFDPFKSESSFSDIADSLSYVSVISSQKYGTPAPFFSLRSLVPVGDGIGDRDRLQVRKTSGLSHRPLGYHKVTSLEEQFSLCP